MKQKRMKQKHLGLVLSGLTLLALPAWGDDADTTANPQTVPETTVVITATRTPTPLQQVASSVTVITAQQLQETHHPFVADALREVPGLYVSQTGGPGGLTTVSLRGADAGDTLVLMDGVPVNDPSSPDRSYDFAHLTVDNIQRIEVLRGSQSTLYGSDAMAGVINIITRRGNGQPKSHFTLEGGRYQTAQGTLESSGSVKNFLYSASASRYSTAGFPLADLQPGDMHNDGYRNTTLSARVGGSLSDSFSLDLTGRYLKGITDYADFPIDRAVDDGSHVANTEQETLRVEGRLQPPRSKWENIFGVSTSSMNRDYFDQVTGQDATNSNYNGRMYKLDWQANYTATANNLLTLGAESEQDQSQFSSPFESSDERHLRTTGYYAQDQITLLPGWFATAGLRLDDHETFGSKATYRVTSSYQIPGAGSRLKATYGTGFKAPTLYQLFDPSIGNAGLRPEASESYDIGIEQPILRGRGAVSATYFHSDYTNLIQYAQNGTPNGQYENVSKADAEGVELLASYRVASTLRLDLNYTYTKTHDQNGNPLPRRPGNLYGVTVNYQCTPRLDINFNGVYVGDRLDPAPYPQVVTLPNYALFNMAGSYRLSSTYRAFLRVDNLFDKNYEEVYSYATARRGIYGGLTSSF